MKNYTFKDLAEIQRRQNYKYIGLFDQQGKAIVCFNSNKNTPASRLKEIETRLNSEVLPDGNYFFKGKNSPRVNTYTDDYLVIKGKPDKLAEPAPVARAASMEFSPAVLSYDSALKMQVENERLKIENANLLNRIEELENEIFDIQEEKTVLSEDAAPSLFESGKAFLSEIVTMAAPLLDKHFELKEKQLNLQAYAMQQKMQMPHKQPSPEQQPEAKARQHENRVFTVENWINQFKESPEQYEILANIYNNAENEADFLTTLQESAPELFTNFQQNFAQ